MSFSQPRSLTWEYQPLNAVDTAALAVADDVVAEPDEFLSTQMVSRRRSSWT